MDWSYWALRSYIFCSFSLGHLNGYMCLYDIWDIYEEWLKAVFSLSTCLFLEHAMCKNFSWAELILKGDVKTLQTTDWSVIYFIHRLSVSEKAFHHSLSLSAAVLETAFTHKEKHWSVLLFSVFTVAFVGCNEWMKRRNAEEENKTKRIYFHSKSSVECLMVIYLCFRT